jgi:hypothetical protein
MKELIDYTLFTFRIFGTENFFGLVFGAVATTIIRSATLYFVIRVAMTAVNHGSF